MTQARRRLTPAGPAGRGIRPHRPGRPDGLRIHSNASAPDHAGTEGVAVIQFEVPAIVPADPQANVTDLLVERVKLTPNLALFAVPDGAGWRDITAAEFQKQVIALAKGFAAAGIQPGDKVAFIARTTYQWTLVDFALFFAGAVMVPVYDTSSPAQIAWNLTDSGAIACIVESTDHTARLDEVRDELPLVRS